jgi:hypothetical protein
MGKQQLNSSWHHDWTEKHHQPDELLWYAALEHCGIFPETTRKAHQCLAQLPKAAWLFNCLTGLRTDWQAHLAYLQRVLQGAGRRYQGPKGRKRYLALPRCAVEEAYAELQPVLEAADLFLEAARQQQEQHGEGDPGQPAAVDYYSWITQHQESIVQEVKSRLSGPLALPLGDMDKALQLGTLLKAFNSSKLGSGGAVASTEHWMAGSTVHGLAFRCTSHQLEAANVVVTVAHSGIRATLPAAAAACCGTAGGCTCCSAAGGCDTDGAAAAAGGEAGCGAALPQPVEHMDNSSCLQVQIKVYGHVKQPAWVTWPAGGIVEYPHQLAQILLELQDAQLCTSCSAYCPARQLMEHSGYCGKAKQDAVPVQVTVVQPDVWSSHAMSADAWCHHWGVSVACMLPAHCLHVAHKATRHQHPTIRQCHVTRAAQRCTHAESIWHHHCSSKY